MCEVVHRGLLRVYALVKGVQALLRTRLTHILTCDFVVQFLINEPAVTGTLGGGGTPRFVPPCKPQGLRGFKVSYTRTLADLCVKNVSC